VRLVGVIARDGTVTSLQLDTTRPGTGNPDLINAAMDAVRQWRYKPALLNGQPIDVATSIQVTFTLVE
jgi:protein TonB